MDKVLAQIHKFPVLPVYYHDDPKTCILVVEACYRGGIRVFEFVNRGEKGLPNFQQLLGYRDAKLPDLLLGIGTIKDAATAATFVRAGADFVVSPIVKAEIAAATLEQQVLWIPGCMTPTEIDIADSLGAPLVKLFPGDTLGAGFLKAVKPLFPRLQFMPTGGVNPDPESIRQWFDAGVAAVGLGSKLFAAPEGATDFKWLELRCRQLMEGLTRDVNKSSLS